MFYLTALWVLFLLISVIIWLQPPDRMAEEMKLRPKLRDIGPLVNLCQTAKFGSPSIRLLPPRQEINMELNFDRPEFVTLTVPLLLDNQREEKSRYLDVFAEQGLKVQDGKNEFNQTVLSTVFDRQDENLTFTIRSLYRALFNAKDYHAVNVYVRTLQSDYYTLLSLKNNVEIQTDYEFKSQSQRFDDKSVKEILGGRILETGNILLYPVVIVFSYMNFGIAGMCWAALIFFALVFTARYLLRRNLSDNYSYKSLPYLGLICATLLTGNLHWVQYVPSVFGVFLISDAGAQFLGSKKNAVESNGNVRDVGRASQIVLIIVGLGLILFNEWARRSMNFDSWVWFFGFVRFEIAIVGVMLLVPIFALFQLDSKT